MTSPLYLDNDCLSAFLWIARTDLLTTLYPKQLIVPKPVYNELKQVAHLKVCIDQLIRQSEVRVQEIAIDTAEYDTYLALTTSPATGCKITGKGEAAAIALVKQYGGTLASNNLRDIQAYVSEYKLNHTTTADILVEAFKKGIISETEGNVIWAAMISKRRKLGASSFTEYLERSKKEAVNLIENS